MKRKTEKGRRLRLSAALAGLTLLLGGCYAPTPAVDVNGDLYPEYPSRPTEAVTTVYQPIVTVNASSGAEPLILQSCPVFRMCHFVRDARQIGDGRSLCPDGQSIGSTDCGDSRGQKKSCCFTEFCIFHCYLLPVFLFCREIVPSAILTRSAGNRHIT